MSYSEISGIELFQTPFSHNVSRQPMPYSNSNTANQPEVQDKAPQQSGHRTTVQQPVSQKTSENAVKPASAHTVKKPDIMPKKVVENGCAKPESGTKVYGQEQDEKSQADVPEKQPSTETAQKAQAVTEMTKSPDCTDQPETQKKELILDMSSSSGAVSNNKAKIADDTENRKAHEAAETKRKKEWDARQLEKKLAEAEALKKLQNMSDDDVISASTKRIGTDVERITRRNMKECVAEHVQDLCRKDPAFARLTMNPRKSMAHCFRYINRKAKEFILQEMEENGIPKDSNGYGSDVPDGLCYQWSEDYFHDANAPEDTEKEEKFVPKPYTGAAAKPKMAASKSKKAAKPDEKSGEAEKTASSFEQMSLF